MTQRLARLLLALGLVCLPALGLATDKLAFIRGAVGHSAVWSINSDGTGLQQLSQPPAGATDWGPPLYSPNAAKIAFSRLPTNHFQRQIWVMNADGTGPVLVSPANVSSNLGDWSPDSTKLAYVAGSLFIVNADGTGARLLADNALSASFSPDGTKIAFTNSAATNDQIYVVNTDGTGLTNLSQTPGSVDAFPYWSPDGAKIVFFRNQSGGDVYVMNPDGSAKTNLTGTHDAVSSGFWSRDGRTIAFIRQTGTATADLYTVAASGGAMTRLTTNLNVDWAAWALDGASLAVSSNGDLFTLNADGTALTNITNDAASLNDTPQYAPNSNVLRPKQLYFIHADHLNTPRMIADSAGTTVWRWDQGEPFGNDVPNNNPSGAGTFDFPLRFPGQYFDRETNLAYNRMRDYDPAIGRYVQSDPVGLQAGLNTYTYVNGTPISASDLLGLLQKVIRWDFLSAYEEIMFPVRGMEFKGKFGWTDHWIIYVNVPDCFVRLDTRQTDYNLPPDSEPNPDISGKTQPVKLVLRHLRQTEYIYGPPTPCCKGSETPAGSEHKHASVWLDWLLDIIF